jgi:hypothetical protein
MLNNFSHEALTLEALNISAVGLTMCPLPYQNPDITASYIYLQYYVRVYVHILSALQPVSESDSKAAHVVSGTKINIQTEHR